MRPDRGIVVALAELGLTAIRHLPTASKKRGKAWHYVRIAAPAPAAPRKLSVVPQAQTHRGWTHHLWRCRLTAASLTTTASK